MQCPYCENSSTRVVDSRESSDRVRRRRECSDCGRRFTTYEEAEKFDITVIKQDDQEEEFDESKIREGVEKAGEKTSLSDEEVEEVIAEVRSEIRGKKEVKAEKIGDQVKESLKKRDEVAYLRFASVYDSFDDAESFMEEAKALQKS